MVKGAALGRRHHRDSVDLKPEGAKKKRGEPVPKLMALNFKTINLGTGLISGRGEGTGGVHALSRSIIRA